jgi:hypothetical protein
MEGALEAPKTTLPPLGRFMETDDEIDGATFFAIGSAGFGVSRCSGRCS